MSGHLIEHARRLAGLTQADLAALAGTSRPTLSAYESGRKSPTLATTEHFTNYRRPFYVANRLWRLPVEQALATVVLPNHLNWSTSGEAFDLRNRRRRMHCYEIVLREGSGKEIMTYVDGTLLADLWPEIFLPQGIKTAWTPIVEEYTQ
jgi:transcriptional regulator with XRE-family HTH domain